MDKIIAFYRRPDGAFEKNEMFSIDFREAAEKWPDDWSLEPPPKGSKVVDKTPKDTTHG